jgi:hypothetical protein
MIMLACFDDPRNAGEQGACHLSGTSAVLKKRKKSCLPLQNFHRASRRHKRLLYNWLGKTPRAEGP